jgi:hypothetical protein
LIRGGRYRELVFGQTRLLVAESANSKADGYFLEEDTMLSMAAHASELMAEKAGMLPLRGGTSIQGRGAEAGQPAEFMLIVNETRPLQRFRPGWLEPAWKAALHEADHLQFNLVSAPLVGCIGGAALDAALTSAATVLTTERFVHLRAVELVCGSLADEVFRRLVRYAHPVRH